MKLKVGICEDDPFTRSTLEASLAHSDVEVCFAVGTTSEAIKGAQGSTPHAVLIDMHLGKGPTGLDLARALRRDHPGIGLVFLTSFESPRLLVTGRADLPSGSRYLVKREIESVNQILAAIQESLKANQKTTAVSGGATGSLTQRQLEVLRLIAQGKTNVDIAEELHIELKTVEGAVNRIAKNLGIESRQNTNQRVQMARAYLRASGELRD